jgi:hypothetical protein
VHKPKIHIENKIIYFNPNSPHGDSSKQMPNKVEPFKMHFDVVPEQTLLSNKHLSWTFPTWPSTKLINDVNGQC